MGNPNSGINGRLCQINLALPSSALPGLYLNHDFQLRSVSSHDQLATVRIIMSIIYHSLDRQRQEIRLLQLLPSTGPKHARIPECRLIHASLSEKPQYTALSYVWGNPERTRVIVVDGLSVRIPRNLFDALIALRPVKDLVTIWIDFLCINQADNAEKSWQIELMKDIYSQAEEVLAWLGLLDATSERTIKYLDTFGRKAEVCGFHYDTHVADIIWRGSVTRNSLPFELTPSEFQEILIAQFIQSFPEPTWAHWFEFFLSLSLEPELTDLLEGIGGWHSEANILPIKGMKRLFTRPWWGRVWVLQEIALAEQAVFICGSSKISRRRLCAAINAYSAFWALLAEKAQASDYRFLSSYHLQIITDFFHFQPAIMTNAWRLYKVGQFTLLALLRLTCVGTVNLQRHGPHNLDSTDPRDKIFALLGLASDQEDLRKKGVYPDYSKSCEEVYTLTAAALLKQGHLSMLSFIQYPKIQNNLPSWVPDWSKSVCDPLQVFADDHMTMEPEFYASGSITKQPNLVIHKRDSATQVLSLDAYLYDMIYKIADFPRRASSSEVPISDTFTWPKQWLIGFLRLTYQTKHDFTFEERLQAAARSSVAGAAYLKGNTLSRVGDARFIAAAFLLQWSIDFIRHNRIKSDAQRFLSSRGLKKKFQHMKMTSLHLLNEINGRSLRRLPFITSKGNLGSGSDNLREGDCVAIIKGAQVPYILRLQPTGAYQLIGEAYVDGIMDGEVSQQSNFTRITLV